MTTTAPVLVQRLPRPLLVAAAAGAAALAALVVGLLLGTAVVATPAGLPDAGTLVRWGLPIARTAHDLSAALTVGLLVLGAVVLPGAERTLGGPALRATRAALWTALGWLASAAAVAALTYADVAGQPLSARGFSDQLVVFLREIDLGRAWLAVVLAVCAVAVLAASVTGVSGVAVAAVVSVLALMPLAGTGHAAGAASHEAAVTSLAIHLVGVTVWVGGLAALVWLARDLTGPQLAVSARRFSTLALWCFIGVAVSGTADAWVNLGDLSGLFSAYGVILLLKVGALGLLGLAGLAHRERMLPRLDGLDDVQGGSRAFALLAAGEVVVMAAAVALGVALARTASPRPVAVQDGVIGVLGYPLPPPLDALHWVTQWRLDLLWALVAATGVWLYVGAVIRLRRRGDRWSTGRTVSWVLGCLLLFWVTSGAPGAYGRVLFSVHMTGHMLLSMAVPLFLVMAAPVTLALRALPARGDGTRGPREWLLVVLHSRYLQVLSHPVVAGFLFAGSLVAFYWTGWFEWALRSHTGHVLMTAHFVLVGYLFAWVLAGPDPGPRRPPYPLRLLLLFAVVSFHAFFGVVVMGGNSLLAPDWFTALDRSYRTDLLADQQQGGAIAWGFGELPTLVLALLVLLAWIRDDGRESRRHDRQAERDGGAELSRYNAYLASLADQDPRSRGRSAATSSSTDSSPT